MNMVSHPANGEYGHRIVFADTCDVSPKARLGSFGDRLETTLGGENQMDVVLCVARQRRVLA